MLPDASASPWAPIGPITSWAGAAGGSRDPVENASFMPWLVGTALLHSAVGDGEARCAENAGPYLLSILAFSLSLMGAFLVRSGVLDLGPHLRRPIPGRGLFILGILVLVHRGIAGAVCLAGADAACRAGCLRPCRARARWS
jgi:cytochrome c biogenesis factor